MSAANLDPLEAEDLAWLVALVEDWLLHASDETVAELAHFCGPNRHVRTVIGKLGAASIRLRSIAEDTNR
jgi:hypothetical protein